MNTSLSPIRVEKPSGTPGRVFSIGWVCPRCHGKVDKIDPFCRNCGIRMLSSAGPQLGG